MTNDNSGLRIQSRTPVMRATVERHTKCGDDIIIRIKDIEGEDPSSMNATASIKMPIAATPLNAVRWSHLAAAMWIEVRDRDDAGGRINLDALIGKRVRVLRAVLFVGDEFYDGWTFEPVSGGNAEVKVRTTLARVGGAIARFFGGK